MADRRLKHVAVPSTRTRSGSEAIRKRVAQLMQGSGAVTPAAGPSVIQAKERIPRRNSPSLESNRASSRERNRKTDTKEKPLPAFPDYAPRPLKRKKSSGRIGSVADRSENMNADTRNGIVSSSHQSSNRIFDAMVRSPPLEHDLPPVSHQRGKNMLTKNPHYDHDNRLYNGSDGASDNRVFNGLHGAAEYDRMNKEIETLKEALHDARKVSKRHIKKLEETKLELSVAVMSMNEKESELARMKGKCRKNEELLSTIESSVQCQICMDLPDNPFALSPCGHVLCLSCLQEWFRKAPPTLDDMDIDPEELTDPHYILMRTKSCPSCRAVIKRRPVPVFMVKAVASALKKSKPSLAGQFTFPGELSLGESDRDNPWKGIFPSSEEESGEDDSGDSGDGFDLEGYSEDDEERQVMLSLYQGYRFHASSDSEVDDDSDHDEEADHASDEEGDVSRPFYVLPRWEPPSVDVNLGDYTMSEADAPEYTKLLQRGCGWEMIQNYEVSYSHRFGIIVSLRSLNHLYASDDDSDGDVDLNGMSRVYLGWNIALEDDDADGETFMTEILEDIKTTPTRWHITPRPGVLGAMDARRLINAGDVGDYDTTDTEVWIDAEDF
ncbi:hypothetical protein GALMADRAFT_257564 [Galerina marginata CBS 339.88]|uniref:RING-type domain-containing protein n=1 Tax=Galerina marginata (strain CBS 339.88) TaxID=685588 RepID=A0A067SAX4_GALM3|nr:hypothetical protein GALMADRAFT_257564 [Galerina marginata CBS 339.88]